MSSLVQLCESVLKLVALYQTCIRQIAKFRQVLNSDVRVQQEMNTVKEILLNVKRTVLARCELSTHVQTDTLVQHIDLVLNKMDLCEGNESWISDELSIAREIKSSVQSNTHCILHVIIHQIPTDLQGLTLSLLCHYIAEFSSVVLHDPENRAATSLRDHLKDLWRVLDKCKYLPSESATGLLHSLTCQLTKTVAVLQDMRKCLNAESSQLQEELQKGGQLRCELQRVEILRQELQRDEALLNDLRLNENLGQQPEIQELRFEPAIHYINGLCHQSGCTQNPSALNVTVYSCTESQPNGIQTVDIKLLVCDERLDLADVEQGLISQCSRIAEYSFPLTGDLSNHDIHMRIRIIENTEDIWDHCRDTDGQIAHLVEKFFPLKNVLQCGVGRNGNAKPMKFEWVLQSRTHLLSDTLRCVIDMCNTPHTHAPTWNRGDITQLSLKISKNIKETFECRTPQHLQMDTLEIEQRSSNDNLQETSSQYLEVLNRSTLTAFLEGHIRSSQGSSGFSQNSPDSQSASSAFRSTAIITAERNVVCDSSLTVSPVFGNSTLPARIVSIGNPSLSSESSASISNASLSSEFIASIDNASLSSESSASIGNASRSSESSASIGNACLSSESSASIDNACLSSKFIASIDNVSLSSESSASIGNASRSSESSASIGNACLSSESSASIDNACLSSKFIASIDNASRSSESSASIGNASRSSESSASIGNACLSSESSASIDNACLSSKFIASICNPSLSSEPSVLQDLDPERSPAAFDADRTDVNWVRGQQPESEDPEATLVKTRAIFSLDDAPLPYSPYIDKNQHFPDITTGNDAISNSIHTDVVTIADAEMKIPVEETFRKCNTNFTSVMEKNAAGDTRIDMQHYKAADSKYNGKQTGEEDKFNFRDSWTFKENPQTPVADAKTITFISQDRYEPIHGNKIMTSETPNLPLSSSEPITSDPLVESAATNTLPLLTTEKKRSNQHRSRPPKRIRQASALNNIEGQMYPYPKFEIKGNHNFLYLGYQSGEFPWWPVGTPNYIEHLHRTRARLYNGHLRYS